jgi:F0F1-type ATP synthase membrane subunit b/b'
MTDFFTSPSFWLTVSFVFFLALIIAPIVKIVIGWLDGQRNIISQQLDDSRLAKEEAEAVLKSAREESTAAKDNSEQIVKNAIEEGKRITEDYNKKLEEFLDSEEKRTKANIARLEMDSVRRLQDKVFDISFSFSKNILSNFSSNSQDFRSSLEKSVLSNLRKFKF